jgi:type IV secretion system protein VirB6
MNPLGYILGLVDAATATYILNTFSRIAAAANPVFRNLMILYFILYGLGIWRGVIKTEISEFFWNVIRASIVYAFVFTWTIYSPIIVDFLTNGPDALAGIITGSPTGSIVDVIGDAYVETIAAAELAYSKSGWIMPAILGSVVLLSGTILVVFATALLAIAKIALAILIGIGGLAFLMLLFKGTQKMFEAWMQQCINFFLYVVFTISVLVLTGGIYRRAVLDIPNDPSLIDLGSIVPLILIGFTMSLILKQVPALASAIAGGVQISSLGAEGAPGRMLSNIYNRYHKRRITGGSRFRNPFKRRNTVTR